MTICSPSTGNFVLGLHPLGLFNLPLENKFSYCYQPSNDFVMLSSHQRRFDGALKRRAKRHQSVTKLD